MIVIVDGNGLLCTQYYGSLPEEVKYAKTDEEKQANYEKILKSPSGQYVNGIQGFLQVLAGIVEHANPDKMVVCFDASRASTFRREMYAEYKAQRGTAPEPLSEQIRAVKDLVPNLGITTLSDPLYEADDFAGTVAKWLGEKEDVYLVTKDRDYFQLVGGNVKAWMLQPESKKNELIQKYGEPSSITPLGCYEYDSHIIANEIGLPPEKIVDWKAMSGDASDNIPGIKGVSDKTSIPLLKEYGSLENILNAVSNAVYLDNSRGDELGTNTLKEYWKGLGITRPGVAFKAIAEGRELGLLSKELATIKTDVPISKEEAEYASVPKEALFDKLRTIATKWKMDALLEELDAFEQEKEEDVER